MKKYSQISKIEKLDEDFIWSIMEEMGKLGLIGIDAPENMEEPSLIKLLSHCIEGVGFGGLLLWMYLWSPNWDWKSRYCILWYS